MHRPSQEFPPSQASASAPSLDDSAHPPSLQEHQPGASESSSGQHRPPFPPRFPSNDSNNNVEYQTTGSAHSPSHPDFNNEFSALVPPRRRLSQDAFNFHHARTRSYSQTSSHQHSNTEEDNNTAVARPAGQRISHPTLHTPAGGSYKCDKCPTWYPRRTTLTFHKNHLCHRRVEHPPQLASSSDPNRRTSSRLQIVAQSKQAGGNAGEQDPDTDVESPRLSISPHSQREPAPSPSVVESGDDFDESAEDSDDVDDSSHHSGGSIAEADEPSSISFPRLSMPLRRVSPGVPQIVRHTNKNQFNFHFSNTPLPGLSPPLKELDTDSRHVKPQHQLFSPSLVFPSPS
ncbi:hypothetical protein JCM5353_003747 [Sporobolomyces roseus]